MFWNSLLYLSAYLERNRQSYYEALQTIHETGDPAAGVSLDSLLATPE